MSKSMIEISSLNVKYDNKIVLKNISMIVNAGEIFALVGPNGAGKTTLIRAISGVVHPKDGQITINDKEVNCLNQVERSRYIAVVPQARDLPAFFTVYQTVLIGRTPYLNWLGKPNEKDHRIVKDAIKMTQLEEITSRLVGDLSGGEQQRVLLARALAQDAAIWLMDEPTTHLDFHHQFHILNVVKKLVIEKNLAILMVVHDLNLVGSYADRVAVMKNGEMITCGYPREVLTEDILSRVFNVPVHVIKHPETGLPIILPNGHHGKSIEISEEGTYVN